MTLLLEDLLARLNAAIEARNARIDVAVTGGRLDREVAVTLKVRPGMATGDLIRSERWPDSFVEAVKGSYVQESPQTILELAKFVKEPTATIQQLCHGCENARGAKRPVVVRTLDLAHLLARSAV